MIPGEYFISDNGPLTINEGREALTLEVTNRGDRPVQVGSHFHFAEANASLDFDREAAKGKRIDIRVDTGRPGRPFKRKDRKAGSDRPFKRGGRGFRNDKRGGDGRR